jgi:hypothetical protein
MIEVVREEERKYFARFFEAVANELSRYSAPSLIAEI